MTTDELRAKFEAWFVHQFYDGEVDAPKWDEQRNIYEQFPDHIAWKAYQAAHASRDAEVEALRRDAERYRFIRDVPWYGKGHPLERVIGQQRNAHWDEAIDAALEANGHD